MTNPTKTRRQFTEQQKLEAVALCMQEGLSRNAVAQRLGLHSSSLARWVRQARIDSGQAGPRDHGILTSEERTELTRLRKENRELRREKDFFRLAAAHFAKEQLSPKGFACLISLLIGIPSPGCAGSWMWPAVATTPGGSDRRRRGSGRRTTL
jgi:transposase-like protein